MLVFTYKRYGEFGDQVEVPSNRQIAEPSKLIFYTIPHFDEAFFLSDRQHCYDWLWSHVDFEQKLHTKVAGDDICKHEKIVADEVAEENAEPRERE